MHPISDQIVALFKQHHDDPITAVDKLPRAGSDRHYFRIFTAEKNYIATYGENVKENESFIYFSEHFNKKDLPVPEIYHISEDVCCYIQEDFGNTCLLDKLESEGFTTTVYELYKQSLAKLARLQVKGHAGMDYSRCLTNEVFGKQAIMADLLYFKYYFLDALAKPYDKQKLIDDFEALSNYLSHTEYKYFMFRDFQSRNIMVKEDNSVGFIDYQGGMNGAPQYDVASLLWQAKANLPDDWKQYLLDDYINAFEEEVGNTIDRDVFSSQYHGYVLIRLLQVLGAYGFRGLFERKAHFLNSIPGALHNLKWFVNNQSVGIAVPEFKKVLEYCISDDVIAQFTPVRATEATPLRIVVNSFSYLKTSYPIDATNNGGGFVFDMRGILNPGRYDEYKYLTGHDKSVKDFLEQQTKMYEFLNGVYSVLDIAVGNYIKRDFEYLSINFGCTGGQHRSVYAAEAVTRHLKNKFNVQIELSHLNSHNWLREEAPGQ